MNVIGNLIWNTESNVKKDGITRRRKDFHEFMSMNVGLGNHQALEEKERMILWTVDLYGEQELHVFERDFLYESMERATLIKYIFIRMK